MTLKKSLPPAAEEGVAFIAKEFDVTEYQGGSITIALLEHKKNRRRKREVDVYALTSKTTYRFTQLNTDELGVCNFFLSRIFLTVGSFCRQYTFFPNMTQHLRLKMQRSSLIDNGI